MNTNQQFAMCIHALTLLAASEKPLTSKAIASSVDTNPVVIRRAMASLREHGIVSSKPGAHGGWHLSRKPKQIALCDIYRSLGEGNVLAIHDHPSKHCAVGKNIRGALQAVFGEAQIEMEKALGRHTIADVLKDVQARARS
jgi:Rrf2 family protein